MSSYQQLAGAYDELTWDVGYEKRADFLEKLFRRSRISRLRSISRPRLSRISPGGLRSAPRSRIPIPRPSSLSRTRRIPPRLSSRSSRYSRSRPLPRLRSALPAAPKPAARASVRTAAQPCAKVPLPYGKRTDTQTTL